MWRSHRSLVVRCFAMTAAMALAGCAVLNRPDPSTSAEPSYAPPDRRPVRLALVLSTGALRGFAHVGVLRELKANGIEPDLIVGASAGAIVGALAASGLSGEEMNTAVDAMGSDIFMDWTVPKFGLIGGRTIHEFIDRHAKHHHIEAFPVRFAAVAVEADRACVQVFNMGDPGKAVQASSTVPVILSPPRIAGRYYLDGALASPLPVRIARALGAERIIAVDVTLDPAERGFVNILEAFWRTMMVMRWALVVNERPEADYVIKPTFMPEYMINMGNRHSLVEAGAQAVRKELPAIRQALQAKPAAPAGALHPSLAALLCPEVKLGAPH